MGSRDWSAPESMEAYIHSNKFGKVIFTPITAFMSVNEILKDKVPEIEDVLISLDDAEKITLITENNRGYVSFCFPFLEGNTCFALQYSCSSRAAVCKAEIVSFHTGNDNTAQEQINSMAPKISGPLPIY
jgi:hypothetical protein